MRSVGVWMAGGAVFGGVVGLLGLILGLLGAIGVVVLIVLVAVILRQLPVLAGGLTGLGVTWLTLTISRFVECDPTDSFCGEANYVPLLTVSSLLAFVGVILGAVSIRRATYDND